MVLRRLSQGLYTYTVSYTLRTLEIDITILSSLASKN